MASFCGECGFALDKDYNFCPNCGSKIEYVESKTKEEGHNNSEIKSSDIVICSVCGEENSTENNACEYCGAVLKVDAEKKVKKIIIKNDVSKSERLKELTRKPKKIKRSQKGPDNPPKEIKKELNKKFIYVMIGGILAFVLIVLFLSGVFESSVTQVSTQTQQTNSGINLNNLTEIAELEKKVAANPNDLETLLHLAHLQNDSGLYEKAIANYQKYLDKRPADADARIDMGVCYYNLGNYDSAITEMKKALEYSPKHQIGHLNLGIVNLTAGNLQEAKDWFQKTVELNPNSDAGLRAQELLKSH